MFTLFLDAKVVFPVLPGKMMMYVLLHDDVHCGFTVGVTGSSMGL